MVKTNRYLFVLTPLLILCGLAVAVAHTLLNSRIIDQQKISDEMIYVNMLGLKPGDDVQLESSLATDDATLLGLHAERRIYIARRNHCIVGIVLPLTARQGYAGDIDLLLGLDTNGKIISVDVMSHRETRDLGDQIEQNKSNWLDQFRGASFNETKTYEWQLRSEGGAFDGITGATVTSRAVVKAVQQGLAYFELHRNELMENSCRE